MDMILKANALVKGYGRKKALDGIDIEIPTGKIIGLLGPNGSGKTTFIKIAAGMLKQTSGSINICEKEPGVTTKAIVSYLPDKNFLHKWMKIKDAVNFFKDFYKDFNYSKAVEMLKFMELDMNSNVKSLSKGMMEKLHLTLILCRDAKLYLLDEPLAGVDPSAREKIIDAIIDNYDENSSIIITTHLVRDIERIFDEVMFISQGKIVLTGSAEELRMEKNKSIDELFREVF